MRKIPFAWTTLFGDHLTTAIFIPLTPWYPAGDVDEARMKWELNALMGPLQARPAYQKANSTDESPVAASGQLDVSYKSSADVYYPADFHALAGPLSGSQLVRFGLEVTLASGSMPAWARATGEIEIVLKG